MVGNRGIHFCFVVVQLFLMSRAMKCHTLFKRNIYIVSAFAIYIYLSAFRLIDTVYIEKKYIQVGGIDAQYYRTLFLGAGVDLVTYIECYQQEFGYKFLNWIIYRLSNYFSFFLVIFHSLAFWLYWSFLKKVKIKKKLFLFVILCGSVLYTMFNTMRNDFAVLIWLNAFMFLQEKKYKKAVAITILAMTIHRSAVIGIVIIVLYWLCNRVYSNIWHKVICLNFFMGVIFYYIGIVVELVGALRFGKDYLCINSYLLAVFIMFIAYINRKKMNVVKQYALFLLVLAVFLSTFMLNLRYTLVYRLLLYLLPILYIFIFEINEEIICVKKSNINYVLRIIISGVLLYKAYDILIIDMLGGYLIY